MSNLRTVIFDETWDRISSESYMNGLRNDSFVYKDESLSQVNNAVGHGVYAIYGTSPNSPDVLLYVGKGGTVRRGGILGRQGIKKRLQNKGPKGMPREVYFQQIISKFEYSSLCIRWIQTCSKSTIFCSPAYAEAKLLEAYLQDTGDIPPLNQSF